MKQMKYKPFVVTLRHAKTGKKLNFDQFMCDGKFCAFVTSIEVTKRKGRKEETLYINPDIPV